MSTQLNKPYVTKCNNLIRFLECLLKYMLVLEIIIKYYEESLSAVISE